MGKSVVIIMNKMAPKKRLFILTEFLFLTIFLLGITSSVDLCWVETSASTCTTTLGNKVVMHMSSPTNAHGELESYAPNTYSNVLCCSFGGGSTICSGNNKIVGLSSSTNAHAERPENSNYNNNACYDSLESCFSVSQGNCAGTEDGELEVLHLSSNTNAHLGSPIVSNYDTKICCTVNENGDPCELTNAYWSLNGADTLEASDNPVLKGTTAYLIVEGNNCEGASIDFEVFEDDVTGDTSANINPQSITFDEDDMAIGGWSAEWIDDGALQGNPEYYFDAILTDSPATSINSKDVGGLLLEVE